MKGKDVTKAYLFSFAIAIVAVFIVGMLSESFPSVSTETSMKVLENIIQLDGLLFGFTAVMFTIIYGRRHYYKREVTITVFMMTSFWCYIISLGMSFSYLMQQSTRGIILAPAGLAIIGAVFSSLYFIMALMQEEKKE